MTATTHEDPDFKKILAFLLKAKGFDGHRYKVNYVKRRVAVRMRATSCSTYADYLRILQLEPEEPSRLLDRLTIHVTEFFRDPSVYKTLEERTLPAFPEPPSGKLKVWCAACSTGEEPYSVSILLKEWAASGQDRSFEILATDIDTASVKTAEKGEYPLEAVKGVLRQRTARWFRTVGPRVLVSQELKHCIHFRTHDLLRDWPAEWSGFQFVFCRNLLIYLTPPQQQTLYEKFAEVLAPGGFLLLGLAETLLGPARRFYRCVDVKHRIYQKAGLEI